MVVGACGGGGGAVHLLADRRQTMVGRKKSRGLTGRSQGKIYPLRTCPYFLLLPTSSN
jgi:hypothetical protein